MQNKEILLWKRKILKKYQIVIKQQQIIYGGHFDIPTIKEEIIELTKQTEESNFWNDRQNAESILKTLNEKKNLVSSIETQNESIRTNLELLELLELEPDLELEKQLEDTVCQLNHDIEQLNLLLLLNGPYDKNNCILEVHSGAGGTEACDWALMLYRMYTRW